MDHIWKNKGHGQSAQRKQLVLEALSALLTVLQKGPLCHNKSHSIYEIETPTEILAKKIPNNSYATGLESNSLNWNK